MVLSHSSSSSPLVAFLESQREVDEEEFDYDEMFRLMGEELDDGAAFSIGLARSELLKLDQPFTPHARITIYDGRACCPSFGFAEDDPRRALLTTETVVEAIENQPITLRQILKIMSRVPEYAEIATCNDHICLELIEEYADGKYSCFFGS